MPFSTKAAINQFLNPLGVQMVRVATLQHLVENAAAANTQSPVALEEEHESTSNPEEDASFARNKNAHRFRIAQEGPTEIVPLSYLTTLQRESLALRDTAGEIARLKRELEIAKAGQATVARTDQAAATQDGDGSLYRPVFEFDGLRNDPQIIHNHDFMRDPRFIRAYKRAVAGAGIEQHYYWRAHVAIWCASLGLSLEGDFVECGVWKGLLSTTIMEYLNWSEVGKKFYLFDTFRGVDETQLTEEEIVKGTIAHFREMYKEDLYEGVVENFAEYKNVNIVQGSVPDSLVGQPIDKVAYLSIDMNNATPEIAAINYFWDKLSPGAPVLLDDYGFINYEIQKKAWDQWASDHQVAILALPTGQGLIIKPGLPK